MSSIAHRVYFESERLDALAIECLTQLEAKYGTPSCGRNRATFISSHCVIKFPLNFDGIADNAWEAASHEEPYLAKGRPLWIGDFNCVVQERLTMPRFDKHTSRNYPDWVREIDCAQVGYDKKGQLKAYDFGPR